MLYSWFRRITGVWIFLLGAIGVLTATQAQAGWPESLAILSQQQQPPQQEPPTFELPEVVVPGRRPQPASSTPATVSVLTSQDLERLGVLTVAEALQFVSEVHIRQQGGLGALSLASIRGTSPTEVLVLIDGVPVNSVMLGLFDLSTVSTAQVERVEVLKGPFSAIYGGEALGGVINIVTAKKAPSELRLRVGSLSTVAAVGRWSTGQSGTLFSVDRFSSNGERINSDVMSTTFVGRVGWHPNNGDQAELIVNHFSGDLGVPGSLAFPSPQARQNEVRTIVSGRWERSDVTGQWMAQAYWWDDDIGFVDPNPMFPINSQTTTQVIGGTLQRVLSPGQGILQVLGIEWKSQALQSNTPVGSRSATVGALYLQDDRQLSSRTLLSTGVRYDAAPQYGGQLNPRLGLVHLIRDGLLLRAAVGRTFRAPSFSELFFVPFNNPQLRPESAWSADATLEWRAATGFEVRSGLFATEATDLIRPDAMFVPQNIGHASMRGGSLEVSGTFAPHVFGTASVTVLNAIDRDTGAQLLRVPWVTASAALHYRLGSGTVSALLTYVGTRPDVDPATFTRVLLSPYTVFSIRYTTGGSQTGRWQVGIDNVLDAQYTPIAGFPATGRTLFVAFINGF